jgi:hypothetical protein
MRAFASYFRGGLLYMPDELKSTRPIKLNDDEVSEEIVNDSLGEVTPADSTGLDAKDEAHKQGHPMAILHTEAGVD